MSELYIPDYFGRKGFDGIIIIKNGKFHGGILHISDMNKEEWKLIKKSMTLHIKTIGQLEKLQLEKPKDVHVIDYKSHTTLQTNDFGGKK